jgi:hypothetical protein
MTCNCGKMLVKKKRIFEFTSKIVGKVKVKAEALCCSCGEAFFGPGCGTEIFNSLKEKERQAIHKLPVKDFITRKQAANFLELTTQQFQKNDRIKRGFIMSCKIGEIQFYYLPSVKKFKLSRNKQDGQIYLGSKHG